MAADGHKQASSRHSSSSSSASAFPSGKLTVRLMVRPRLPACLLAVLYAAQELARSSSWLPAFEAAVQRAPRPVVGVLVAGDELGDDAQEGLGRLLVRDVAAPPHLHQLIRSSKTATSKSVIHLHGTLSAADTRSDGGLLAGVSRGDLGVRDASHEGPAVVHRDHRVLSPVHHQHP